MATNDHENRICYLDELDNLKVHHNDPDVRNWEVYTSDDARLGKVENLIVDREAKEVRYLDVHLEDEFLKSEPLATKGKDETDKVHEHLSKEGHRHVIIPIGMAEVDESDRNVHLKECDSKAIAGIPHHARREEITPQYEVEVRERLVSPRLNEEVGRWRTNRAAQPLGVDFYNNIYYSPVRHNA